MEYEDLVWSFEEGRWIKFTCNSCGHFYHGRTYPENCLMCGGMIFSPWFYRMPIPGFVAGKVIMDGRRVVPRYYVEVRAYLNPHPDGNPDSSWINAEAWFRNNGAWTWIENDEWYAYSIRIWKDGKLYFGKEE